MALAAVLFGAALFSIEPHDDGWLLMAAGAPVDVRGTLSTAANRLWRDCTPVKTLEPHQAAHERAARALRQYSPPDSASARVRQMQALGPWRVVQAEFDTLAPVVVVVREEGSQAQVLPQAVWSGTPRPWDPAWRIRHFLRSRAPELPVALLACLDPIPAFQTVRTH